MKDYLFLFGKDKISYNIDNQTYTVNDKELILDYYPDGDKIMIVYPYSIERIPNTIDNINEIKKIMKCQFRLCNLYYQENFGKINILSELYNNLPIGEYGIIKIYHILVIYINLVLLFNNDINAGLNPLIHKLFNNTNSNEKIEVALIGGIFYLLPIVIKEHVINDMGRELKKMEIYYDNQEYFDEIFKNEIPTYEICKMKLSRVNKMLSNRKKEQ